MPFEASSFRFKTSRKSLTLSFVILASTFSQPVRCASFPTEGQSIGLPCPLARPHASKPTAASFFIDESSLVARQAETVQHAVEGPQVDPSVGDGKSAEVHE